MSDVYFVIIPVVIVVVILKLCLICWRVWLYQKRRERVIVMNAQPRHTQPTARIVGVERTLGPEGYTQRTAYVINEQGVPPRQITRTVIIRPRDCNSERPHDPNMPPTYDQAVTGKDKSVKVNAEAGSGSAKPQGPSNLASLTPSHGTPAQGGASIPVQPSAPYYDVIPPTSQTAHPMHGTSSDLPPPPAYSLQPHARPSAPVINSRDDDSSSSLDAEDTAHLLA